MITPTTTAQADFARRRSRRRARLQTRAGF